MSKDPAVLFYTSDFLSGTTFFTNEEVGIYIRLLCQQHQCGRIPNGHMTTICPQHDHPVRTKFKQDENGFWYNERMEIERDKRINYCKSRSNNKKGVNQYTKAHDRNSGHMTYHTTEHMENENDNYNTTKNLNIYNIEPNVVVENRKTNDVYYFVSGFSDLYYKHSELPYKASKADYKLAKDMINSFTTEMCILKAKILLDKCLDKSLWFTKNGIADFTIRKLSLHWNEIIQ